MLYKSCHIKAAEFCNKVNLSHIIFVISSFQPSAFLGEWVIHVTSDPNDEGTPQPKIAPQVCGGVNSSDPDEQGRKLLIRGPELDSPNSLV